MSYHFSPVRVEAFLEDCFSGGARSAPLRLSPIPARCYSSARTTGFSIRSRYGTTSQPLMADLGRALLTWLRAGFPVRTYPARDEAKESPARDRDSGAKWRGSFVRYDPDSCLWKTPQCSLLGDSESYSETWPRWGTMRDGECWELTTPELPIRETGSGLWPTPTVIDATMKATGKVGTKGRHAVQLSHLANGGWINDPDWAENRVWPTPTCRDYKDGKAPRYRDGKLQLDTSGRAVQMFPTPASNSGTGGCVGLASGSGNRKKLYKMFGKEEGKKLGCQSLNPTWVELLMGWPMNWTRLEHISCVRYCQWLMEFSYDEKTRTKEVLRVLRKGNAAKEVSREIGRSVSVQEAAVLLSIMCKHANRPDQARIFMACAETFENEVRGVRPSASTTSSPCRSEYEEQQSRKHSDTLQKLSRLLAHYGKEAWMDGGWENAVSRVATGIPSRVDRLKAIGNGQVPQVVRLAWEVLVDTPSGV